MGTRLERFSRLTARKERCQDHGDPDLQDLIPHQVRDDNAWVGLRAIAVKRGRMTARSYPPFHGRGDFLFENDDFLGLRIGRCAQSEKVGTGGKRRAMAVVS